MATTDVPTEFSSNGEVDTPYDPSDMNTAEGTPPSEEGGGFQSTDTPPAA
jgi:hypothetical protein